MFRVLAVFVLFIGLFSSSDIVAEPINAPGFGGINMDKFTLVPFSTYNVSAIIRRNVVLREKAKKSSNKLGVLAGGAVVRANSDLEKEWVKVQHGKLTGFIMSKYLIPTLIAHDVFYKGFDAANIHTISLIGHSFYFGPGSFYLNYQDHQHGIASYGPIESYCREWPRLYRAIPTDARLFLSGAATD